MIHETVPQNTKTRTPSDKIVARRLRSLLIHMVGKRKAKPASWISRTLGLPSTATSEKVRAAAKILLVEEGLPVVSCSKGFYYASGPEDLVEYRTNLRNRMQGLERDCQAVSEILAGTDEQRRLFE